MDINDELDTVFAVRYGIAALRTDGNAVSDADNLMQTAVMRIYRDGGVDIVHGKINEDGPILF